MSAPAWPEAIRRPRLAIACLRALASASSPRRFARMPSAWTTSSPSADSSNCDRSAPPRREAPMPGGVSSGEDPPFFSPSWGTALMGITR